MTNPTEVKRSRGRPKGAGAKYKPGKINIDTTYLESHPEKLLAYMKEGYLDCEIYAAFEVCKDTFYEWLRSHPEFKHAHDIGLSYCQSFYVKHARLAMLAGDDKGAKYFIMLMNNKFGWGSNESRNQITNNTQINIKGNMQVLSSKSTDELLELLKSDIDYLQTNNVIDVELLEAPKDAEDRPD